MCGKSSRVDVFDVSDRVFLLRIDIRIIRILWCRSFQQSALPVRNDFLGIILRSSTIYFRE